MDPLDRLQLLYVLEKKLRRRVGLRRRLRLALISTIVVSLLIIALKTIVKGIFYKGDLFYIYDFLFGSAARLIFDYVDEFAAVVFVVV